jgi:hypothetical protein
VWRVEKQGARERRLHGDFRGFLVANFTDENDIGIVTQNRAKTRREGQAALSSPGSGSRREAVFDRVFDR